MVSKINKFIRDCRLLVYSLSAMRKAEKQRYYRKFFRYAGPKPYTEKSIIYIKLHPNSLDFDYLLCNNE